MIGLQRITVVHPALPLRATGEGKERSELWPLLGVLPTEGFVMGPGFLCRWARGPHQGPEGWDQMKSDIEAPNSISPVLI